MLFAHDRRPVPPGADFAVQHLSKFRMPLTKTLSGVLFSEFRYSIGYQLLYI
jgi:hypothetical protein